MADSVHLNTDNIDTLFDCSPNSYHAIQTNVNSQPKWIIESINQRPTIQFDGIDDYLIGDTVKGIDTISTTIFFVCSGGSVSSYVRSIFGINEWTDGLELNRHHNEENFFIWHNNANLKPPSSDLPSSGFGYKILGLNKSFGQKMELFVNTQTVATSTDPLLTGGFTNGPFLLGDSEFEENWKGNIAEAILFDTCLPEQQADSVYQYLRYKYAPPVNLGADIHVEYGFGDTTITTADKGWFTDFQWSTGENDTLSTLTVTDPGTYAVTVTDIFGFESSDSLTVQYPEFGMIPDQTICLGDTITWDLAPKAPYEIAWSTGETTSAIDISREGTYTVTITDTLGNSWSPEPLHVAVDSFPAKASLGTDTTLCSGNRLELTVGQDEAVDFLWSDGSTGDYYLIDETEQVSVQVTNERGCVAYDTIEVDVAGKAPTADFTYDRLCRDIAVQFQDLSTAYNGASLVDYQWDFNTQDASQEVNPQFIFSDTGQVAVSLSVLTNEGCHNDTTHHLQIHELPKAAFSPKQVCENATIQLANFSTSVDGEITNYNWIINGDYFTQESPAYTFEDEGETPVQLIIATEYNCPDTVSEQITVKPAPDAAFIFDTACVGEVVHFSNESTGNLGQQLASFWRFEEESTSTNQHPVYTFTETGAQTVQLVVTQLADGCRDTAIHTFRVHNLPEAQLTMQTGCENDTISLQQTTNWGEGEFSGTILWVVGDTAFYGESPVFIEDDAGTYPMHITVKNAAGCGDTASNSIIIHPNPQIQFSALPDTIFVPSEITFDNVSEDADYQWWVNQQTFSSLLNPTFNFDTAGEYIFTLTGTNEDGCSSTFNDTTQALEPYIDGAILECRAIIDQGRLYVSADLVNAGTKSISNPEMRLILSNGQRLAEIFPGTLHAGQQETYSFKSQYFLEDDVNLEWIIVELVYETDQALANNTCNFVFGETTEIYAPYPNPAESTINIDFSALEDGTAKIILYNLMGEVVLQDRYDATIGLNRLQIPNPARGGGVHTLQIDVNGTSRTFRVVL